MARTSKVDPEAEAREASFTYQNFENLVSMSQVLLKKKKKLTTH